MKNGWSIGNYGHSTNDLLRVAVYTSDYSLTRKNSAMGVFPFARKFEKIRAVKNRTQTPKGKDSVPRRYTFRKHRRSQSGAQGARASPN